MTSRTWPVLIFGFGSLVLLIALAGLGASRRARQIQDEIITIYSVDRETGRIFRKIDSDIQLSGVLVRDYLLDPSHLTADLHRRRLIEIRAGMAKQLQALDKVIGKEELSALAQLRQKVDAYWDSLDPIFEWTPQQKMAYSALFLRQQVLPKRDAVFELAGEIQRLNQTNLERQQRKLDQSRAEFRSYLRGMMGIVLSLGLMVAVASIYRISRLERRTEEQQRRTERAERELRKLSRQLVQAQEAERKSISRELHDQVGQMLTGLRMELGRLEDARGVSEQEFHNRLGEARQLAEQTLSAVRNLAMGLRPSMLDDLGLGPALEWQGREFSRRSGIPVAVQVDGSLDALPDSHRTCVFRVVQEALTNCARHSRAKNIRVTVHGEADKVSVSIQDDGVGMAAAESPGLGMGLIGIEERARELGGSVTIRSQPGKGTSLRAEIPVEERVRT